jgi:hypothetical protein
MEDHGITQVLGTAIVVGITVLLGVAVAIMVTVLRDDHDSHKSPPLIAFSQPAGESSLHVIRADGELDWFDNVRFVGTCTPTLNGAPYPTASGSPVAPTDVLGCQPGEDIAVITVQDDDSRVVYQAEFSG